MNHQMDIMEILLSSGPVVKLVLVLLVGFSIASWTIVFKKKSQINELMEYNTDFYEIFKNEASFNEVLNRSINMGPSPFKTIFSQAVEELRRGNSADPKTQIELVKRGILKGVNLSNMELDRSLPSLASISTVAPFVGLFGTVWGIINSFTGLAGGGATLDAVAPGIAEALVATAVGLLAAIPASWFYNSLSAKNEEMNQYMENFAQEILNRVELGQGVK